MMMMMTYCTLAAILVEVKRAEGVGARPPPSSHILQRSTNVIIIYINIIIFTNIIIIYVNIIIIFTNIIIVYININIIYNNIIIIYVNIIIIYPNIIIIYIIIIVINPDKELLQKVQPVGQSLIILAEEKCVRP
jgi:cellulose synthase/poly-beta-1,6-N-acetylglucosamine synthase-like glycosyltransferase